MSLEPKFRLNARNIFLTFPACKQYDIGLERAVINIKNLYPALSYILVARELHKDGEPHYHMVLQNPNKFDIRNKNYLDAIIGKHGDYRACRDINGCIMYCKKDNNYIEEGVAPLIGNQSGHQMALAANTLEEGMNIIKQMIPRDYLLHGMQISQNLQNHLAAMDEFKSAYDRNSFIIPDVMKEWVESSFVKKDRYKLLMIISPGEYGKTQWARSLGKHIFFRTNVDWAALTLIQKNKVKYVVYDDIKWEFINYQKAALLGMGECIVTDKYVKKTKVCVDIPSIFLCNEKPMLCEYWRSQIVCVELEDKLF